VVVGLVPAKEPICLPDVSSVLEFGPGRGSTKTLIEHFGIEHLGVGIDPRYPCDIKQTIKDFTSERTFDMVCSFQTLEHNPLETLPEYLAKFRDLSNRYVYISVPYSARWISLLFNINLKKKINFKKIFLWTFRKTKPRDPDVAAYAKQADPYAPHWWEVGDKRFSKRDMLRVIQECGLAVVKHFHNPIFPYHLFYLLEKR
jgi:hypothetical protein